MRIGLCDDKKEVREMVKRWLSDNHPEIFTQDIYEFNSGEALLEHLRFKTLDIVFLDCRMNGMDGIDTAKAIRKTNTQLTIIILTEFSGYAIYGYDVEALNFIVKDSFSVRIHDIFDNAVSRVKAREAIYYSFAVSDGVVHVDLQEIVYIESYRHRKILMTVKNTSFDFLEKFDHLEDELKKYGFIRPHKGYLVNFRFVTKITLDNIELSSGETIPMSRRRYRSVLDEMTLLAVVKTC